MRPLSRTWTGVLLVLLLTAAVPSAAQALSSVNNTPFPSSPNIASADWTSGRHGPPSNQFGDILPTPWADNNNLYVEMDDGGTSVGQPGAFWRNSFAEITGAPLHLHFKRIGVTPAPATWAQIHKNHALWSGPLGHNYSTGFAVFNHVFFATRDLDWNWNANGPFLGLTGIAYSTDHGQHWHFPNEPFPGATGNLNWVQFGRASYAPDGYAYAIATEREFNASTLILGRTKTDIADMTNPARWQWSASPIQAGQKPRWSSSISQAVPIATWSNHFTYPRMVYDAPLHKYLLTFTYSYGSTPPAIWKAGAELVILEGPHPWGPFTFVSDGSYFGPSNGYDPAFPVKWISSNGQDLWLIWAANFDGCNKGLKCSAAYGFNYQHVHLNLVSGGVHAAAARRTRVAVPPPGWRPPVPPSWRNLPATKPLHPRPLPPQLP